MIIRKTGNIFTTQCQTIVNTINCVGVMGAGIAYEFKLREPDMFDKYKVLCEQKKIDVGLLWIYNAKDSDSAYQKILNFPTKKHWKFPTKEEYLLKGLQKFMATYQDKGIESIAFPLLGADRGGLGRDRSIEIMEDYLSGCDIDIEIWEFDPAAKDDLFEDFRTIFLKIDDETIKKESGVRIDIIRKIRSALEVDTVNSLSGLIRVKGVGATTMEKLFSYIRLSKKASPTLF